MRPGSPSLSPLSPEQARDLQRQLAPQVITEDRLGPVRAVAGLDAAYDPEGRWAWGAAAVLSLPDLLPLEEAVARVEVTFPYRPGLFSFRELPALLAALGELSIEPDLLLVDGQGVAHPRRFGLACHLGTATGLPAVGVAKTLLTGEHGELPPERGFWAPLTDRGETVGAAVRTRTGVKPVYVSIGHRVGLETAVSLTLACTPRYRLPEPLRRADRLAAAAQG